MDKDFSKHGSIKVPTTINGVPVEPSGEPMELQGELWQTLVPTGDDDRIWEFSLTTGRLLKTR